MRQLISLQLCCRLSSVNSGGSGFLFVGCRRDRKLKARDSPLWKLRQCSVRLTPPPPGYENSHSGQKTWSNPSQREDDENVPDTQSVWKVEYVFIEPLIKYTLGWPLHNKIHHIISNTGAEITHVPTMFTDLRGHLGRQRNKVPIHLSKLWTKIFLHKRFKIYSRRSSHLCCFHWAT